MPVDISTLENWLWEAACSIRGPLDAPKYKDYILPLLFYKRLYDVFDDELNRLTEKVGNADLARDLVKEDRDLIRFYIPNEHKWNEVRRSPVELGQRLTDAMRAIARENPRLSGVIDRRDFNATEAGQRLLEDEGLARLMEILNRHRLGLHDVEPDILGRAYEYLLRKFAEGGGQSAGEFFTPREVGLLMATILDPQEGETLYDPACGSGGLLIKAQLRLRDALRAASARGVAPHDLKPGDIGRPLQLYGQEINPDTFAMARMNAFIHDMEADIRRGDTMRAPRFLDEEGRLQRFDKVIEAVILLPENLFYNTSAPGIIMVVNKAKAHPGQILLINASRLYAKGRPKNYLAPEHIQQIYELYRDWKAEEGLSAIITTEEAARNDYNLSPSRYVASNDHEPPLPLEEALVLLAEAEEERREADAALSEVLAKLGFEGWQT
ncbi:MAG: N-6 DNA methylase [Anaerolineae bacterium]